MFWKKYLTCQTSPVAAETQHTSKTNGFTFYSYSGPYIWNSLAWDLRHCSPLLSFKTELKTLPFSH